MTGDQRTEALARLRAELIEGGLIEGRDDGPRPRSTAPSSAISATSNDLRGPRRVTPQLPLARTRARPGSLEGTPPTPSPT